MAEAATILAFSGSPSRRSLNDKVVRVAMEGAVEAGARVRHVLLADYEMPVFNVDHEDEFGMHENARAFKALMMEHRGFLISAPENNGSVTAAFKNAIDWVSRTGDGNDGMAAFRGKYAALLSASPGVFGGVRSLDHTRYMLARLGVWIIPQNFPVSSADAMFDDEGRVVDDKAAEAMRAVGRALAETLKRV
jgi:NAD(P)H-dependent FMN reductase